MSTKKMKSRKTYTSEFKAQTIDLAKELGVKKAAEKLGIPNSQTLAESFLLIHLFGCRPLFLNG